MNQTENSILNIAENIAMTRLSSIRIDPINQSEQCKTEEYLNEGYNAIDYFNHEPFAIKEEYPTIAGFDEDCNNVSKAEDELNVLIKKEPSETIEDTIEQVFLDTDEKFDDTVEVKPEYIVIKQEARYNCQDVQTHPTCNICLEHFRSEDDLIAHKYTHTEDTNYTCLMCHITFDVKTDLYEHLLKCGYSRTANPTENNEGLLIHKSTPIADRPYECDICQKRYKISGRLLNHKLSHAGEKPYECDICHKKYATNCSLTIHKRAHTSEKSYKYKSAGRSNLNKPTQSQSDEKPFECNVCAKKFKRSDTLVRHQLTHSGEKPYECDICHKKYSLNGNLSRHIRSHTNEKCYECVVCQYQCNERSRLDIHMQFHYEEPKQGYPTIAGLEEHSVTVSKADHELDVLIKKEENDSIEQVYLYTDKNAEFHNFADVVVSKQQAPTISRYEESDCQDVQLQLLCNICLKICSSKDELVAHKYTHTADTSYTCLICHITIDVKKDLYEHVLKCDFPRTANPREHTHVNNITRKVEPFQCDICPKSFENNDKLLIHKGYHTVDRTYECNICQYKCGNRSRLIIHKLSHSDEKPLECTVCQKIFTRSSTLIKHQRVHTGEKPYECNICPYKCSVRSSLKIHMVSHTDEKPFECNVCLKRFKKKGTLLRHQFIHTGEKPYECDVCHRKFNRNGSLTGHKRTLHADLVT